MNHWPEFIDVWHYPSFRTRILKVVQMEPPMGHKWPGPY